MSDPITVVLADDHPLFRAGVRQAIESSSQPMQIVAEVGDGTAALAQIQMTKPDFALLDLAMPGLNGFEVLEALGHISELRTKVVIISMHADASYATRARELGAVGFIAKEDAVSELSGMFAKVEHGFFMSPTVGVESRSTLGLCDDIQLLNQLTPTECRVLAHLAAGMTSKLIARQMGVSPRTVQAHRRNIAGKLALTGPNRLLEFAVRHRQELTRLAGSFSS